MTDKFNANLDSSTEDMVPRAWFEDALRNERTWLREAHAKIRDLELFGSRWTYEDEKDSENKIFEKLREYLRLLADGELDKAADLSFDIFRNTEIRSIRLAQSAAKKEVALLREELNFQHAVRDVENDYPWRDLQNPQGKLN